MKAKILIIFLSGLIINSTQAQDFQSSKDDFLKMARYLSNGSGKWMAPNPNYDSSNPRSSRAIGLWFDLSLNENLLKLSIATYRGDTVHLTSDALWIWHPGEQRIKYHDISMRGTFIEGETYFTDDKTFVTRNFTYMTDGTVRFARGENYMTSEKEHFTRSLAFEDGEWKQRASFTWKLTSDGEGYKAIKRY